MRRQIQFNEILFSLFSNNILASSKLQFFLADSEYNAK